MTKESLLEKLREKNRTVLEMELGILALAILFQIASLPFPGDRLARAVSLFLGCLMAFLAVLHMYRTLDRALDLDEKSASKMIYGGYLTRYLSVTLLLIGSSLTHWLNPLLMLLGCMTLKFTAYLQPFTHKLLNKLFHETDPEEFPEPEQEQQITEENLQ